MPETQIKGYAIVDYSGFQFRVETGQELKVPFAAGDPGANLVLDRVLLLHDGTTTHFGAPAVEGAVVDATILSHGRDPKVTVFKFRRRKGYRLKRGHRQQFSMLRINGIRVEKPRPASKAPAEKAPAKKPAAKPESKAAPKKTATTVKTAPGKPSTAKKTGAAKKTAAAGKTTAGKTAAAKKTGGTAKKTTSGSDTKKKSSE